MYKKPEAAWLLHMYLVELVNSFWRFRFAWWIYKRNDNEVTNFMGEYGVAGSARDCAGLDHSGSELFQKWLSVEKLGAKKTR